MQPIMQTPPQAPAGCVNVIVRDLPGGAGGSLLLRTGHVAHGLSAGAVLAALAARTCLPLSRLSLVVSGRLASPCSRVSLPGESAAFVAVRVRRALPGGKGGFGATLRGSARAGSVNQAMCRDLEGRRVGEVERARRATEAVEAARRSPGKRTRTEKEEEREEKRKEREAEQVREETAREERAEVAAENVAERIEAQSEAVADDVAEGLRERRKRRRRERKLRRAAEGDVAVDAVMAEAGV